MSFTLPSLDALEENTPCKVAVERYIQNCKTFDITVDPSVVIALLTGWDKLKPTKKFGEGDMLSLMGILEKNDHIKQLDLGSLTMHDKTFAGAGNCTSNARILAKILQQNHTIEHLDISNTGLDDDGIAELCEGIKHNTSLVNLNLASNHFGAKGAETLKEALEHNQTIRNLDVSRNALGYNSINSLLCSCAPRGMTLSTHGNFVFEEILNSVSHGVAFLGSVVGAIVLISEVMDAKYSDYHFWAICLYSFALMFLFLSSCLFHSFFMMPTRKFACMCICTTSYLTLY